MELITKRLRLRLWRDEDLPAFAALNSDPRVMQHMAKLLDHVMQHMAKLLDHPKATRVSNALKKTSLSTASVYGRSS